MLQDSHIASGWTVVISHSGTIVIAVPEIAIKRSNWSRSARNPDYFIGMRTSGRIASSCV
jgi:hypothetical protein